MDRNIIQKKSRLKIIGAVQNQGESAQQFLRVFGIHIGDDAFDQHI